MVRPQTSEAHRNPCVGLAALLCIAVWPIACSPTVAKPYQVTAPVTLTVGYPHAIGQDPLHGITQAARLISYEGLVVIGRDGRVQPRLAASWTESPDGLQWIIRLRPDALFHDGSPVDAESVKASLERSLTTSDRDLAPGLADITSVEALGPHELSIRLRARSSFLLDDLSVPILKWPPGKPTIAAGPFVRESAKDKELVMTAFPQYYRGKPTIDRIVWKIYPTVRTAWAAMMRGEVDFLYEVGPEAVDFVQGESSLTVFRFLRNYAYGVILNAARPEFAKPDVRRALNYAIDRRAIVRSGFRDHGVAATGPAWPQHWAFDASVPTLSYDPVRATALLESAELRVTNSESRAPSRLRFTCLIPENFALWERMGLMVQRNLAQIGVDMKLEAVPFSEFNQRIGSGQFDAVLTDFIVGNSPTRPYFFWHSQSKLNSWGYNNSKVDDALDRLRRASSDVEYRSAFSDFQRQTLEDPPAIFLVLGETSRAVSNRFQVIAPPGTDILPTIDDWKLNELAENN